MVIPGLGLQFRSPCRVQHLHNRWWKNRSIERQLPLDPQGSQDSVHLRVGNNRTRFPCHPNLLVLFPLSSQTFPFDRLLPYLPLQRRDLLLPLTVDMAHGILGDRQSQTSENPSKSFLARINLFRQIFMPPFLPSPLLPLTAPPLQLPPPHTLPYLELNPPSLPGRAILDRFSKPSKNEVDSKTKVLCHRSKLDNLP